MGAGFTGLWTAYYLLAADPTLRVVVLEQETAGFGASGRNGGWCSALFPASLARVAAASPAGRAGAVALQQALQGTVREVGRVAEAEEIACDFALGGTIVAARTPVQLRRAAEDVAAARDWGLTSDDLRLLGAQEARERLAATRVLGGTFTPHCAALHPARLVEGLARAVEHRGGTIHEATRVLRLAPREVTTTHGRVRADVVVQATEGWTARLPGRRRAVAPVYSLVVATEPLPPAVWDHIGLAGRETFSEHRHLVVYGQRTADGRLVFGGRGAPYHLGSGIRPEFDRDERVWATLRALMRSWFPVLAQQRVRFTHAWGGPLGIPRDWFPSVGLDRSTGLAWAGGYVGDGVAASNLAGRTLRDLVLGHDTDLAHLPWVGHRSKRWEPEPWRWLGINAGLRAMTLADREETLTGRPSVLARAMAPLLGG